MGNAYLTEAVKRNITHTFSDGTIFKYYSYFEHSRNLEIRKIVQLLLSFLKKCSYID
jgi:hypothetical protein